MSDSADRPLTATQAAAMIYRTAAPSAEQIRKVRHKLASGQLRTGPAGPGSTTAEAVAEYLARWRMQEAENKTRTSSTTTAPSPRPLSAPTRPSSRSGQADGVVERRLSLHYRLVLKDYFLSVISPPWNAVAGEAPFVRAVRAGQAVFLLCVTLGLIGAVWGVARSMVVPEHRAVEAWLSQNVPRATVLEWVATQPTTPTAAAGEPGTLVRVRYRYFQGAHGINTERTFIVRGGVATLTQSNDDP